MSKPKGIHLPDETVVAALIECGTFVATAERLGVSRYWLSDRMKKPEFQKAWREVANAALDAAAKSLQASASEAVNTAREIMKDPKSSQQVKLNAAQIIINAVLRYTEQIDLLKRLEALEERAGDL